MTRRGSRILSLSLGIPLLLVFLTACGAGTGSSSSGNSSQQTVTIKIGSDFPTTQADASAGKPAENGVRFAVDEANSSNFLPGYRFEIVAKDDVGSGGTHDPTTGQKNVNDLIGDAQVAGIVGPLNSSVALTEMPVANNAPIALISPSNTNDCLTQNTPDYECGGDKSLLKTLRPTNNVTYFRTATLDQNQGRALAQYAYQTKGYKSAFVIDDTEQYGAGLAKNFVTFFKQFGGNVIDQRSVKSTNSYETVLTAVASARPDVVFFGGNDSTGGITIRQQMKSVAGLENTPFMVGDGSKTSNFTKNITALGGGPIFASVPGVDLSLVPAAKKFQDDFQKKYGQVGAYSGGAYDNAKIILEAVKNAITKNNAKAPKDSNDAAGAKTFRQAVIDEIKKVQYDGITGQHSFDQNGDTTNKAISIYTIGDANVGDGWKYVTAVK